MAIKVCRKCKSQRTVQPFADNTRSYWTCARCSSTEQVETKQEERLLTLRTVTQNLRAA